MKIRKKKYKCDFLRISRACNIDKNTIGSTKLEIQIELISWKIVDKKCLERPISRDMRSQFILELLIQSTVTRGENGSIN